MARYPPVAIALVAGILASAAEANDQFTVVLHARIPSGTGTCTAAGLPNCRSIRPITQVAPATDFRLYLFLNNVESVIAMQTAFTWPVDWTLDPDHEPPIAFGCRPNMLCKESDGHPPMSYGCAWDCAQGPGPVIIVRFDFLAGASGCLTQLNPIQGSQRVEIWDCQGRVTLLDARDPIQQLRLGSICVGTPGWDACDPLMPVQAKTWGRIKGSYR